MAWYPKAIRKELPQNRTQPIIKPVGVVLHTAVSNGESLYSFFKGRSSGVESHFYVRESGVVEQYMDTARRADCQRDGNYFDGKGFLSIETWDRGHPETTPWNARQITALVELVAWMCRTHAFPAVKATGPQGTGIGYHAQFTGSRYPRWNESHSCPAKPRIAQMPALIAAVKAKLATPIEEDPLAGITLNQIRAVVREESWAHRIGITEDLQKRYGYARDNYQAGSYLVDSSWRARANAQGIAALQKAVAALAGAVERMNPSDPEVVKLVAESRALALVVVDLPAVDPIEIEEN